MNKNIDSDLTHPAQTLQLAVAANQRYYPGLAVALCSALMHLRRDGSVNVLVIDGGIEAESRQQLIELVGRLRGEVCLTFVDPDMSVFDGLPIDYGQSTMTYARLLLPGMLPDQKRVIYLDSDMIFMRDLAEIWDCAQETAVAAAPDYYFATIDGDCPDPAAVGVAPGTPYFNAGLLVMNLELWREHEIVNRCLHYLQERPDWCRWWDQSALNVVLAGKYERLGPEWNTFSRAIKRFTLETNYHYLSAAKPWLVHQQSANAQPFYEYAERLGVRLDDNAVYVKSQRKSRVLAYLSPFFILWNLLCGALWALLFKRWYALQSLKKAGHWCVYLRFWLIGDERQKISLAVEQDFARHFPNRDCSE